MDQEPIWNRTALSANCTTMDAERLAAIGALVQQQNQNVVRVQQAVALDRVAWCYSKNIENTDVVSFNHLSELAIRSAP